MLQFGPNLRSLMRRKMTLVLIVIQIAIAACIISNLSFIVDTLQENTEFPTGIDHPRLFSLMVRPANGQGITYERAQSELMRLQEVSGVESAAAVRWAPLGFLAEPMSMATSPEMHAAKTELQSAQVSPNALRTLGLALLAGRDFTAADMAQPESQPRTVIVSAAAAKALFGDMSTALGQPIYHKGHMYEVIGVTHDWAGFTRPPFGLRELTLFLPMFDQTSSEWRYLVRSRDLQPSTELIETTVNMLSGLYQNRVMVEVERASELFAQGFSQDMVFKNLFIVLLCFLSFVIALAIGGQTSLWVNEQRRNLGIRRALGANQWQIISLVLVQNLLMVIPGLILGIVLSLWLAEIVHSIATMLPPMHPLYLVLTCVVLLTLVLASAAVPAWRASTIAPSIATRRI